MLDMVGILISQYLAALAMFEQTVTRCPDDIWDRASDKNKFWNVAYHTLFFTHLYVEDSEEAFTPWIKHREAHEDFEIPGTPEPYDKATILEYLAFCRRHVQERLPQLDLESSFDKRPYNKGELQIYSLRHIMQHTGELMERLAPYAEEIDWVGSKYSLPR
jgi:hypothetical protein